MWCGEAVQGWGEGKEAGEGRRRWQGVETDKSVLNLSLIADLMYKSG